MEQLQSFCGIFGNSETMLIKDSQIVWSNAMTVKDGALIILCSLRVILRNAVTVVVKITENKFRVRTALRNSGSEPLHSCVIRIGGRIDAHEELTEFRLSR